MEWSRLSDSCDETRHMCCVSAKNGEFVMDLIVEHSEVWAAPIEDKPGGLANAFG